MKKLLAAQLSRLQSHLPGLGLTTESQNKSGMEWKQGFLMRQQMKHKQQNHGNVPMIQNAVIPDFVLMANVSRDKYRSD